MNGSGALFRPRTALAATLALLVLGPAGAVAEPCDRPQSARERTICATPKLKQEFEILEALYEAAQEEMPATKQGDLERSQALWERRRDRTCSPTRMAREAVVGCLYVMIRQREDEILDQLEQP